MAENKKLKTCENAARVREPRYTEFDDLCESINIDNLINTGMQTDSLMVNTGMQTDSRLCVDQGVSCSNSTVTEEHLKFVYPSFYTHTGQADNIIGTMDDIILDNQPRYVMLRESIRCRAAATIEYASWHHTVKKNAQVTVPVINTSATRTPSPDPDSPDETEDIGKITRDFDFAKKLQDFEDY